MKRLIVTYLFFLLSQICISQNLQKVTISFNNVSIKEAILKLEDVSGFKFYFEQNWFDETLISKSYQNESIDNVLDDILRETNVNYLVLKDRIILTKNNAIITKLPSDFFRSQDLNNENNDDTELKTPVFQKEYTTPKNGITNVEILTVGKENKNASKTKFTVSGYIKDSKTNRPIENLTILIRGKNISAITNEAGFYSMEVPKGLNTLEISSLSYGQSSKKVIVYGSGELSFNLEESLEELDEVLIESSKDDNVKKAIVGVTKVDVQGIKNIPLVLGERDVLKVATTMPGIKTAGEGALGYNVRGGKVDENLILFDNSVLYNPSHFFGIFSAINPFATGSVDIYKGSIPAEFGGRLSSVIDISTKEANMEKFSGEGNIGPITGNLTLETPIVKDKVAIMAGVRATYSDWVLKSISEESIKNSKASFYDAILKYDHKIDKNNKIQATGYFSNDEFSISSDSIYSYGNSLASIKWDHNFNDKNRASLILATSQYKFNILYEGIFNRNFDYGYSINETQLKLVAKYNHSKQHKFSYGLSSKLYNIQPGDMKPLGDESIVQSKRLEREKGLESAVFISDLFEVNDKLLLDIGLRYSLFAALGKRSQNIYDVNQPISNESIIDTKVYGNNQVIKTYGGPEIRFSSRYFITPSLSVKAGYNKTIQYSHLLSTNTTASPVDSWKLSDLNIKPERAEQFSVGLYKNFDDNSHEISIEGYYKKMKNLLDFKTGAELVLNENIETVLLPGDGKAYGVEFLIKKKKGQFNGWLSYSYSRSMIRLDSKFLSNQVNNGKYFSANQDRPHDLNLISNYKLTKRYSFSLNFNYQSGRPITYPVGKYIYNGEEQVLYSDRNKYRIPDYYRIDLGVNIEGNHKNVKLAHSFWNISVYNVLGRNNPYSVYFVNENGEIKGYKSSIFSIPIPTITYNFKF